MKVDQSQFDEDRMADRPTGPAERMNVLLELEAANPCDYFKSSVGSLFVHMLEYTAAVLAVYARVMLKR